MCLVLPACSLVYPIAMFVWPWHLGALDWGPVWTGYLGLALFSAAGCAVGMLFSSITESQIIAFFFTAFTLGVARRASGHSRSGCMGSSATSSRS